MIRVKFSVFNILFLIASLTMIISSMLHKYQFIYYRETYTQSILIGIQILSVLLLIALNILNLIIFSRNILKRNFNGLWIILLLGFFSILCIFFSMVIDAPTLIYGT